jgi:hypothetical protein
VHLSSFRRSYAQKFIKTLNKIIEQYSSGLVVPELTETTVSTTAAMSRLHFGNQQHHPLLIISVRQRTDHLSETVQIERCA